MDQNSWVLVIGVPIVTALASAVGYLFKENRHLLEENKKCEANLAALDAKYKAEITALRAEIVSLNVQFEMSQWVGSVRLEANIVADVATRQIVEWNPGATMLLHWTMREMLGKPISLIMPQRYREEHNKSIDKLIKSDELPRRGPITGYALTKDGTEVPVEIVLSGWIDGTRRMMGAVIRRRDEALPGVVSSGTNTGS